MVASDTTRSMGANTRTAATTIRQNERRYVPRPVTTTLAMLARAVRCALLLPSLSMVLPVRREAL